MFCEDFTIAVSYVDELILSKVECQTNSSYVIDCNENDIGCFCRNLNYRIEVRTCVKKICGSSESDG
jgi:hypothetical protein